MGFFLKIAKKGNVALSHKKMANNQLRTMDQFHFFQYVGKSLKGCCTTTCFLFLLKTTCLIFQNQSGTPALTKSYQLPMRSISPLVMGGR